MVSIQSTNLFDVLGGDGEDVGSPAAAVAPVRTPAAGKKAPADPRNKAARQSSPVGQRLTENRPPGGNTRVRNEYPARGGGRSGAAASSRPRDQEARGERGGDTREGVRIDRAPRGEYSRESHQHDKTDHRFGGRGGPQAGRGRAYDRHSGGRRDSEKKATQGWGDPTENPEETGNAAAGTATDAADPWAAPSVAAAGDVWAAPAEPLSEKENATPARKAPEDLEAAARAEELRRQREEEEKQKTLDEYLAEKVNSRTVALPEARKPNEGADTAQWKDAIVLKREEEDVSFFVGKDASGKNRGRKERSNKATVDIEQRFAPRAPPQRTNDGGRREQGGFRGGQGDGRDRGPDRRPAQPSGSRSAQPSGSRSAQPSGSRGINVGDEAAFPTLR